jgi:hypothetical protein
MAPHAEHADMLAKTRTTAVSLLAALAIGHGLNKIQERFIRDKNPAANRLELDKTAIFSSMDAIGSVAGTMAQDIVEGLLVEGLDMQPSTQILVDSNGDPYSEMSTDGATAMDLEAGISTIDGDGMSYAEAGPMRAYDSQTMPQSRWGLKEGQPPRDSKGRPTPLTESYDTPAERMAGAADFVYRYYGKK